MKGCEVFNHFYNADSVTEDLELVSECRRKDAEPVEGQSSPFTLGGYSVPVTGTGSCPVNSPVNPS